MDRAEKLSMEQYPVPQDNIFANSVRNAQRAAFQLGYLTAEEDIVSLIKSRLNEIIGDAQPKPILRVELLRLIKRIMEEE